MSDATEPVVAPSLAALAGCFLQIALSSFGGGLSAWTRRIVIEERRWMTDEQFLTALTITRLFPGPNQVNMAIYVGARFRGLPGALAALAGLLGVPLAILITAGWVYFHFHHIPALQAVLSGVVAAAAGMALSMGFKIVGNYLRQWDAMLFGIAAFVGVSVLKISLPIVVVVLAPLAMLWFWPRGAAAPTEPR
ncbi:MAG: chromate transporter [Deltaproteobacteria bacterium]|nr:chromate transporter [Deltaproteobacteria bacterium]